MDGFVFAPSTAKAMEGRHAMLSVQGDQLSSDFRLRPTSARQAGAVEAVSRAGKMKSASPSRPEFNRRKRKEQRIPSPFPLFAPVEFLLRVFIGLLLLNVEHPLSYCCGQLCGGWAGCQQASTLFSDSSAVRSANVGEW